jgi:hypothetical protein
MVYPVDDLKTSSSTSGFAFLPSKNFVKERVYKVFLL